jgi:hypothetical protein
MPGRLGPRFAIEALFLIALAVGVAYADLASKWIVAVMAGGWLVVALLELTADRIWAAAPPWRRPYYVPAPPPRAQHVVEAAPAPAHVEPEPAAVPAPVAASQPEPEPQPEPEAEPELPAEPEAATMIAARAEPVAEAEQEPVSEPAPAPEPESKERPRPKLEPLESEPKRRWFRRREREEVPDETTEIPLPKHVRLLPASERTDRPPDETDELFVPKREENTRP